VSEGDSEASIMGNSWPTRGCCSMGKKDPKTMACVGDVLSK